MNTQITQITQINDIALATVKPSVIGNSDQDLVKEKSTKPKFKITEQGLFLISQNEDADKPDLIEFVCAKLDVVAQTRDLYSSQWGKLVEWKDPDGNRHDWSIPLSLLQGDGAEVRRILAADGLVISSLPKLRYAMLRYLNETQSSARALGVEKTGWHRCGDAYFYMMPNRAIGQTKEIIRLQCEKFSQAYQVTGTADGWRTDVAALCAANSRCVLALCAGFASMLLEFTGIESGGINLKGGSSTGKTTALVAAASIFGNHNYVNRWRATSNGIESLAAMHNDSLLILDELGQIDPKDAGEIAYLLANGQGKQRSSISGSAKPRQTWRLLFLSAGEIGLAQHMAQVGKKVKAGQEVRMVDVEADAGKGLGIFDTLHDYINGAALSNAIKNGASHHHGHASVAFAKILAESAFEIPAKIKIEMNKFIDDCLPKTEVGGQVQRVCERFALMASAGELASAYGITGWQIGKSTSAVKHCFNEWLESRGCNKNSEPSAILEAVRGFISQHSESRFTNIDRDISTNYRMINNRAGWINIENQKIEYMIDPSVFKQEVCSGFDIKTVCRVLVAANCLASAVEGGTLRYSLKRPNGSGKSPRLYIVNSNIWDAHE